MTERFDMPVQKTRLGQHLILDIWGAKCLEEIEYIEPALIAMAEAAGATLLKTDFHHFGPGFGVTGVAILAESHISIHTWPEHQYAALDIFMCGDADFLQTIPVIEKYFSPAQIHKTFIPRGELSTRLFDKP